MPLEAAGGGRVASIRSQSADQLGDAGNGLARSAEDVFIQARDQADKSIALDANLKMSQAKNSLELDGKNLHGPDAVGGIQQQTEKLQKVGDDLASGMTPRQQEIFKGLANAHVSDLSSQLTSHAAQETKQFESSVRQANISTHMADVANHAYDPQYIQVSKDASLGLLHEELASQGVHPMQVDATGAPVIGPDGKTMVDRDGYAVAKQAELQLTTKLHMGVIDARLSDNNPVQAKAWFEKNKSEIDPSQWERINNATKEGVDRQQAQSAADGILNKYIDAGATGPSGKGTYQDDLNGIKDPTVKQEVTRLVEQGFSQRHQAVVAAQQNLALEAYSTVAQNPGVDARSAVPPQTYSALSGTQKDAVHAINNPPSVSKPDAFAEFNQLRPGDLAALSQHDFTTNYWTKMSPGDRTQAQATWNAARQGAANPKLIADTMVKKMAVTHFAKTNDADPNLPPSKWDQDKLEQSNQFTRDAQAAVLDFETNDLGGKRKPTQPEIQGILDKMTMQQTPAKGGNWWALGLNSSPGTQTWQEMDKIPETDMAQVRAGLRSAGKPATPQNILKLYNIVKGGQNGK